MEQLTIDQQPLKYDLTINISIPIKKVIKTILISQNMMMVIHHKYCYTVLRLPEVQMLANGDIIALSQQFVVISYKLVMFLNNNAVYVLDWQSGKCYKVCQIKQSVVYHERYGYLLKKVEKQQNYILILWKNSTLYHNSDSIGYQINSYKMSIKQQINTENDTNPVFIEKIKNYRFNFNSSYNVAYSNQEVVLIRKKGYKIDIRYLDSQITHQINSIYKLILIQTRNQPKSIKQQTISIKQQSISIKQQQLVILFIKEQNRQNQLLRIRTDKNKYRREYCQMQENPTLLYKLDGNNIYPLVGLKSYDKQYSLNYTKIYNSQTKFLQIVQSNDNSFSANIYALQMSFKISRITKYMFLVHHLNSAKSNWKQLKQAIQLMFFTHTSNSNIKQSYQISQQLDTQLIQNLQPQQKQSILQEHITKQQQAPQYQISQNLASLILSFI